MIIKIAIADDHPLVINGIENILPLYPHLQLIGAYADGNALLSGLELLQPDVLLLDIQLPGQTGDELTPILLQKYPELKILVLTNFDSPLYANAMFVHGAHGYILKTASKEMLTHAIETVFKGDRFIEPTMQENMEQASYKIQIALSTKFSLSPREKSILQLIVDGLTTAQIAQQLFLSAKTVENYRSNIMVKLDVSNVASLVKIALKTGLAR